MGGLRQILAPTLNGPPVQVGDGTPKSRTLMIGAGAYATPFLLRPDSNSYRMVYIDSLPWAGVVRCGEIEILSQIPVGRAVAMHGEMQRGLRPTKTPPVEYAGPVSRTWDHGYEAPGRTKRQMPVPWESEGESAFYVDQNHGSASDSNPGTESLPWLTIQKAAATLVPGQTAYVKSGTYIAAAGCTWTTPAINPANSGTPGSPIAFRAYPGHMPLVTNSVTGSSCPCIGTKNRSYIIWDGFEVVNPSPKGMVVDDSTEIIVERCKIHGMRQPSSDNCDGIRIEDSTNITFRNNEVYDIRNSGQNGNAAAVKIYNSERLLIENNEVYDADAGLRNKVSGLEVTFRYNWIRDCLRWGIEAKNGTDLVYGNIITDCDRAIRVDDTSATPLTTLAIYNNTFARNNNSIGLNLSTPGADVWSNIFYDSGPPESGMTYCAYNLYWIGPTGCGADVVADPDFVNAALTHPDHFKLQASSPAIGAGRYGENIGAYAVGTETIGRY